MTRHVCARKSKLERKLVLDSYKKALNTFNNKFKLHISIIVDEILKKINPISIYLIGSFGRNEGSLYLSRTSVNPIRDYDILIIIDEPVKSDVVRDTMRSINERLMSEDKDLKSFGSENFSVWITQLKLRDINALPLLKIYELKKASKILWGRDIRDSIRMQFRDVSKYNGLLILIGKVLGLLELTDINLLRSKAKSGKLINFVYECLKTNVEISTCLSLLTKIYEPTFLLRCYKISEKMHTLFPELEENYGSIASQMVRCAYRRLLIEDSYIQGLDTWAIFSCSFQNLKVMTSYYLWKAFGIYIKDFVEQPNTFNSRYHSIVLQDLIGYYIKKRFGINSRFVQELAARFYLRYTLIMFFVKARRKGYQVKPAIIFMRGGNIVLKLWFLGLQLLDCLKRGFEVNELKLSLVEERLSEIVYLADKSRLQVKSRCAKFSYLQRIITGLLVVADKVFHRKN